MKHALLILFLLVFFSVPSLANKTLQEEQIPPKDGVNRLTVAAEQGDSYAIAELARKYASGIDVPQDLVQAYMWYSVYPENEYIDQFDDLAEKMTPEQIAKGKHLAQQMREKFSAAKKKTVKGGAGVLCFWNLLASMRAGIDRCSSSPRPHQSLEEAYFWLSLAKDTSGIRSRVGQELTQEQRLAIKKRVAEWKPTVVPDKHLDDAQRKAMNRFGAAENRIEEQMLAENGSAADQFELGADYQYGLHQEQNFDEAEKWYQKAAEQGNLQAQQQLGVLYSSASDGGLDKKHLIELLDEQLARINDYIVANSPTPTTKAELEEKIQSYKQPYGCMSGDEGGMINDLLPPEKLRQSVNELISVPGVPQMEPCL